MTRHTGLRQDSAALKVLCRLVNLGGIALLSRLMDAMPDDLHSMARFKQSVIDPLERRDFVKVEGDAMRATKKGKDYVAEVEGLQVPGNASYVGEVASSRTPPPQRPLDLHKHYARVAASIRREGALDYQRYPSLMADQRLNRYQS